jgi:diaminohydroxyphosphoribosylaminopyrimidine deaminase/5-amino-6-(5-phosphoribosylamino)uracil reductase
MTVAVEHDIRMMEEALALAKRAAGRTSPNPLVGAVIAVDGRVVGRGFHARAGEAHAEIVALRDAGERARGATLYVTLEPCAHAGRTGPCTEAVIAAGIRRVVVAMVDPDTQVNGRGIARFRDAGLHVEVGLLEAQARWTNEFFIKHRRTGMPFVTLKWAMSLDGKTAAEPGRPTTITGDEARRFAHTLRDTYDAVLVGVGTVLADDPQLTCRIPAGRHPLRVVADSRLRTPRDAKVVRDVSQARTLIVTTSAAPRERVEELRAAGAEVLVQPYADDRVDLRALLEELGRRGLLSVLVEGGGTLNASLLAGGLVDKVIALVAPTLLGGARAPTPVDGVRLPGLDPGIRLSSLAVHAVGDDLAIEGYVEGHVER